MKNLKLIFLLFFLSTIFNPSFGQSQPKIITAKEASKLVGQSVIVKAKVITVFHAINSFNSPTFLNLDEDFPNNPIAVVIFEADLKKLNINAQLYKGKTILVRGIITTYKDEEKPFKNKPSITITAINQLEIIN